VYAAVTARALVFAAPVLIGVALVYVASADPAATRVIDRTFSCAPGYVGGLYQVDLSSSYSKPPGSPGLKIASAVTQDMHSAPLAQLASDGLTVHRGLCSPAKGTVKLSTKGMRGGRVPPLGSSATCETPSRPLLRVRAVFTGPVLTQTTKPFGVPILSASGELEQAALAVGTKSGKTIAYLSVTGKDKGRQFTVRTCKED
jgi:hypothetical protein